MHRHKAEVFLSWMAFVSYLSVHQNVNPEQFDPPTSQRVLLRRTSGCTDSWSNHWSGILVARARCQDARANAARMSLKVGSADSMRGNEWRILHKTSCSKGSTLIDFMEQNPLPANQLMNFLSQQFVRNPFWFTQAYPFNSYHSYVTL